MSWENITVGNDGFVGELVIQQDDVAVDISSYTTFEFVFKAPDETTTTKTAVFSTDGTDGALKYTIEDDFFDQAGFWYVAARVIKTGTQITSDPPLRFYVSASID